MESHTTLRWDAVPNAERYKVYRIWANLFPFPLDENVTQTFFQDSQLDRNTEYTYQVSAVVQGREGPRTERLAVRTHPGPVEQVKASLDRLKAVVRWKPLPGVKQYRIYRETEAAAMAPATFLVEGDPAPSEFVDPSPPPGLTSYYFVMPELENVAYSYGGLSFASVLIPGPRQPAQTQQAEPLPRSTPFTLTAENRSGGVQLHWPPQGRGTVYSVSRRYSDGTLQRLEEGLLSTSYWDGTGLEGQPATYVVSAGGQGSPDRSTVSAPITPHRTVAQPDSAILKLRVPGQPEQQARLYVADRSQSLRGVLVVVGQSLDKLPHLVEAAGTQRVAILLFEAFNFGSPSSPRFLSTKIERWRSVLVLDLRRPELSSKYLQEALDEAARVWPEHPEFSQIPLAGWAFSQADVGLTQVLARPEWKSRVAAMIHGNALELNVTIPLFELAGAPHLMILSGRFDPYSQLKNGMAYTPEVTRERYLSNLIQVHRLPITIVSNPGQGHGEGLDTPLASLWLKCVFAQRSETPFRSWQGLAGWTGSFLIEPTLETPWSDGKNQGVKLVAARVQEGAPASDNWSWFPSRSFAEEWQKQVSAAP